MKRNQFLHSLFMLSTIPNLAFSRTTRFFQRKDKGFKIPAGEGRLHGHLKLKGVNANILDVKISGSDTDGDLAIFEQTSVSKGRGTPLHVHPNQDEIFYVIEGNYTFQVGEDKYELSRGDSIFLPRKIPHAWSQLSDNGKMLVTLQPAGKLENFFVTMAALDHQPSQEDLAKIFSDNEMQIVGPPINLNQK